MLDQNDIVQRSIIVVQNGEKLWPPPPVQVSAAPAAAASAAPVGTAAPKKSMSSGSRFALTAVGVAALFLLIAIAPDPLPRHITVLTLSVVIGFYVIGKVNHALHTPLMSITNAISGIIVIGAMLQLAGDDPITRTLSFVAVLLASINIFGGFAVTRRMLRMFSKGDS